MANKILSMDSTRLIIQCLENKQSRRAISNSVKVSRKAISKIEQILKTENLNYRDVLALSDEAFSALFSIHKPRYNKLCNGRYTLATEHFKVYNAQKPKSIGLTIYLIWEEYLSKVDKENAYSYSQFCRQYKRFNNTLNTTMRIEHTPGLYLQLDFTGKHLTYINELSGEIIECEVLVATLPYSSMFWAVALPTTNQTDFVKGIQWIFKKIGYLPKILKIDNLKAGVIKSHKYEPEFNKLLQQMCNHYGIGLEAARPKKPKDKPSVEMSVHVTYLKGFAKMRNDQFTNPNDLNLALSEHLADFCKKPFQKKAFSRQELFDNEKPFLLPITVDRFEVYKHTLAMVQKDCTVMLGEDKHYYTAPYIYVGRKVEVIYNTTIVKVIFEGQLLATHNREQGYYTSTININHYAPNNQSYLNQLKFNGEAYKNKAAAFGANTVKYIEMLLRNYAYEEMAYKSCEGLLRLGTQYGKDAVEKACENFEHHQLKSYMPVKNYLVKNIKIIGDGKASTPSAQSTKHPTEHENLRGPQQYQ